MKIAILKERRAHELRVAASPDSVKKFIDLGCEVTIETGAGTGAALHDTAFEEAGARIAKDPAATVKGADVVLKIQRPTAEEIGLFAKGQTLLCQANALTEPALMTQLAEKGVRLFAMELVPRITRAQSMDILSSQANMAGYKAVLDAVQYFPRALPMMSTAAGRINPANVFVMGVGVAGLQAIATAKRLGAVVHATDVRPDTKEQVESLGGKFLAVENEEFQQAQADGGYAKEMSDDYKKQQADLIAKEIQKMDIVITTAQIPGRKAPVLVTEDHVKSMKPGAVIVDLAAESGGNCPLTEFGKVVEKHGVTLIGHPNVPSRLAEATSQLFARNLLNFLTPLIDKETKALKIDHEDQVVQGTLVCEGGRIVHERVSDAAKTTGKEPTGKKASAKKAGAKKTGAKKGAAKKSTAKKTSSKASAAKSAETKQPEPAKPDAAAGAGQETKAPAGAVSKTTNATDSAGDADSSKEG
ncbi:Re/Si-specific NAD(P)(+) transhydrogenase subunit alpha [Marivibrio halodurans]|uniref:NAD(P) transhydrogenase subunit alpha n=1 Tax=Marivibrio halodurans TaxID=2039722 RepID=A0A8J7SM36_9PROT|nr:Re/Si-specific NAD(P)(+) transhydrogenase subunit alpha [Marivibrio halodurans]MBP5856671.1 Re/Si-specific NAD(P)(+) transhydrogenase subunit alpha [Marivibrio halodurans]